MALNLAVIRKESLTNGLEKSALILGDNALIYADLGAAAKRFANVLSICMSSPIKKSP